MAKDGTRRGGARPGAGRKKKQKPENPEKIIQLSVPTSDERRNFPQFNRLLYDADGKLAVKQAEDVYYSIYQFAKDNGAEKRLPKELAELFAVAYSRWAQAEAKISKEGFLSEHPTTGAPCKSPLIEVANTYSKQAQNYWYSIWTVIKDSDAVDSEEDSMESLLSQAVSG